MILQTICCQNPTLTPTQCNSGLRLHIVLTLNPPPPSKNFSATSRHARKLKFGMSTELTNKRSSKVLWQDSHHPQDGHNPHLTFSTIQFLEQFQAWQEAEVWYVDLTYKYKIIQGSLIQSPHNFLLTRKSRYICKMLQRKMSERGKICLLMGGSSYYPKLS